MQRHQLRMYPIHKVHNMCKPLLSPTVICSSSTYVVCSSRRLRPHTVTARSIYFLIENLQHCALRLLLRGRLDYVCTGRNCMLINPQTSYFMHSGTEKAANQSLFFPLPDKDRRRRRPRIAYYSSALRDGRR
jgi:hypothetical protein